MTVGKLLYGSRFSTALFIHHLATFNLYSAGTYYNGKGQYLSMLGFIEEMAGPLSYTNRILAKAKLTNLDLHLEGELAYFSLLVEFLNSAGIPFFLHIHSKLELRLEGVTGTITDYVFLECFTDRFWANSSLDNGGLSLTLLL